jgi:competence protein ComEC
VGYEAYVVQTSQLRQTMDAELHATVVGRVTSDPKRSTARFTQESSTYTLEVYLLTANGAEVKTPGQIRVLASHSAKEGPTYASIVELSGKLSATNPGERTQALLRVNEPARELHAPSGLAAATNQLRSSLNSLVEPLSPQARALVPGAAIGDTREMEDGLDQAMKVSGLAHITAVSGSHFAVIFLLIKAAASSLPRVARVAIIAMVCLGFVALVHPSGAVLRALTMGLVAVTGLALKRRSQGIAALAFGALALLLYDPYNASDYGFLLSVTATAGLILGSSPLARFLHRPRGIDPLVPRPIAHALAVPIAAQLAVGPILLFLQPYVSLYSVPANVAAAPALAPATIFGLSATFLAPFAPTAALVCAHIASGATWWIAACATFFAGLPGAALSWPESATGAVLLTALSAGLVWWMWAFNTGRLSRAQRHAERAESRTTMRQDLSRGWRTPLSLRLHHPRVGGVIAHQRGWLTRVGVVYVALVMVATLFVLRPYWLINVLNPGGLGQWQVAGCDVGQGDAFLARGADGSTYMFDVGEQDRLLRACLRDLAITRIDIVFISHFHADHYGSLGTLLDETEVGQIITGPVVAESAGVAYVFDIAQRHDVPIAAMPERSIMESAEGSQSWRITWPTPAEVALLERLASTGVNVMNDASLVVEVDLQGGGRAVFLGDLEEPGQERFALHLGELTLATSADSAQRDRQVAQSNAHAHEGEEKGQEGIVANQGYDIVKMAHHGSASQSDTLARVLAPKVTIIGVGEDNSYGHPARAATDLYTRVGSHILTTAECGTFGVYSQAERWFVVGGCL